MPEFEYDSSEEPSFAELNSPASAEVKDLIADLQHSHQLLSELVNLETCALAETMDQFIPGFWSRFLENRHTAVKQFLQQKRISQSQVDEADEATKASDDV
ncbi:MAG TPA: hypothetical protein V6D12_05830 [Candidatus Obscuribacterales bacterium]